MRHAGVRSRLVDFPPDHVEHDGGYIVNAGRALACLIACTMLPHMRPEPPLRRSGSVDMQYLIYLAVGTTLILGWLFWETAGVPEPPPMFHSFASQLHDEAVLKRHAELRLRRRQAENAPGQPAPPRQPPSYASAQRADTRLR
jgi:hypothetical protein